MSETAKRDMLSLALSEEELMVLLAYMGVKDLGGFGLENRERLSEAELALCLSVAERGLVARGFLLANPKGKLQINELVFATVGACAIPDYSLLVSRSLNGQPKEDHYFHISRKMHVLHTIPGRLMHNFVAMEDRLAMAKIVLSILEPITMPAGGKFFSVKLNMSTLASAREAAEDKGPMQAADLLLKETADAEFCQRLAASLTNIVAYTSLSTALAKDKLPRGFALLRGKDVQWLIIPKDADRTDWAKVVIRSASADDVAAEVKSILCI